MKLLSVAILFILISSFQSLADSKGFKNIYYQNAFEEISSMLDGAKPLDFKRAVFVSENAYLDDSLDYSEFCSDIDSIVIKMKWLIKAKRIEKYQTAPFYAAYSYMCEKSIINDSILCQYDFNDFMGYNNWQNMFVTKLIQTKKGNCHSLPFLYKILTDEIGVEAHLAMAPSHVYIKHLDENGKWVNIELTNGGGFSSDAWIISSMGITSEAIKSEIYMDPLSMEESVAQCLYDLAMGYREKYGFEPVIDTMLDKVLEHYPNSIITLLLKADYISSAAMAYLENKNNSPASFYFKGLEAEYNEINKKITALGYTEMPEELYDKWAKSIEEEVNKENSPNNNQESPQ